MKKLAIWILVLLGGLAALTYFTTGEIGLNPFPSAPGDELDELESRFAAARKEFTAAGRAAGLTGMDTTSHAEAARLTLDQIERDVSRVLAETDSEPVRERARRLADAIRLFKRNMR